MKKLFIFSALSLSLLSSASFADNVNSTEGGHVHLSCKIVDGTDVVNSMSRSVKFGESVPFIFSHSKTVIAAVGKDKKNNVETLKPAQGEEAVYIELTPSTTKDGVVMIKYDAFRQLTNIETISSDGMQLQVPSVYKVQTKGDIVVQEGKEISIPFPFGPGKGKNNEDQFTLRLSATKE